MYPASIRVGWYRASHLVGSSHWCFTPPRWSRLAIAPAVAAVDWPARLSVVGGQRVQIAEGKHEVVSAGSHP